MGDRTGIEWTEATWTVDRDGSRVRVYVRKRPDVPGRRRRQEQAALDLRWCRGCAAWLPTAQVRDGVCRPCCAAEARRRYATAAPAIRSRVQARKRGVAALPPLGADYLTEQFDGRCAYCPSPATTWDHVEPVAAGGRTEPGNVVPACRPCNSSKRSAEVFTWLHATGRTPAPALFDVLALIEARAA